MDWLGWLGVPANINNSAASPPPFAPAFDPDRKVAPAGAEEIDFEQRIAQWESLIGPLQEGDDDEIANDN